MHFQRFTCLVLVAVCCACSAPRPTDAPTVSAQLLPSRSVSAAKLHAARAELAVLGVPAGCDAASFTQLRDSLDAVLATRLESKAVSLPPAAERNVVDDIAVQSDGAGGYRLSWSYRNVGDYGLNGEVGISDLTPLGSHLNKSTESADWDKARAADGDNNGVVSVSDLTPIGANLLAQVSGYNIYAGDSATGPWTKVSEVGLDSMSDGFPPKFSVALSAPIAVYYTIAPFDSTGTDAINTVSTDIPATGAEAHLEATVAGPTQTVDAAGGSLTGAIGTPLAGVSVSIPAGAFDAPVNITLAYNEGTITPAIGTQIGPIIEINTDFDGNLGFAKPLEITVPYSGIDIPQPYFIASDGSLEPCTIVGVDGTNGTLTFATWHASPFGLIEAGLSDPFGESYHCKFYPEIHGFSYDSVSNRHVQEPGMAAFSTWLYRTHRFQLYDRWTINVGSSHTSGQQVIAERAGNSISDAYRNWFNAIDYALSFDGEHQFISIKSALRNSRGPVLLNNYTVTDHFSLVMAIGYIGNQLLIASPGSPGETLVAEYVPAENTLKVNGTTVLLRILGSGSAPYRESFANIYEDAQANFNGSTGATIQLTGIQDGDEVSLTPYPINGTIQSGDMLVEKLSISNGTQVFSQPVGPDGNFNLNVPLVNGNNYLYFHTTGRTAKGHPWQIFNKYTEHPLHLIAQVASTGPVFKFEIEALPAQDEFSTQGTFELFAKVMHNGEFVYFRSSSPSTLPSGTGMIDANTFVVLSPDTPVLSPYFRVRRTDPQPEPKQAYFRYRIHNPNHPDPQWHVLENQQVLTATALDDDPHWEDPGFYHGWSSIWGPLTWWHEWE